MIYDVIITGLGPAGSIAAYEFSKKGFNVLAFDKAKFPRYKACGGGVSPKVKQLLPFSIDEIIEREIDSINISHCFKDDFLIKASSPIFYMVMRDRLDYFLLNKAKSAGSIIKEKEKVLDFKDNAELVEVITDKGVYEARFLIGADGANSLIAEKGNLAQKRRKYLTLTAELKASLKTLQESQSVVWIDIGKVPHGCGWIFPKRNHLTLGIGLFYSTNKKTKDPRFFIQEFIDKHKVLTGVGKSFKIQGHFINTLIDERSNICKNRVFLIGEACGLVDPFTGEGIYPAVRSAQILSEIISVEVSLVEIQKKYCQKIKQEFFDEFKIAEYIAKFVYTFPEYSHKLLFEYKHLADYYQSVLKGDIGYKDVYTRLTNKIKTKFKEKGKKILSFVKGVSR